MHIISASRRTDIPACYGEWMMKRIEEGKASYRNPFGGQIHEVSLRPEDVIAVVFWTKNAHPFLPHVKKLISMPYRAYFQYTLTGYGPLLESGIPPPPKVLKNFRELSDLLGPDFVRWRYDPIVMGQRFDHDFHLKNFASYASKLEGYTRVCHISFVQFYKKTLRNLKTLEKQVGLQLEDPSEEEKTGLAIELKALASSRGIKLLSCCYPMLQKAGIDPGACVDSGLIRLLRPDLTALSLKPRPSRRGCLCVESRDVGAYDTCLGACTYCYATQNPELAKKNFSGHNPESMILSG